jgi:hypothetical protein
MKLQGLIVKSKVPDKTPVLEAKEVTNDFGVCLAAISLRPRTPILSTSPARGSPSDCERPFRVSSSIPTRVCQSN